MMVKLNQQETEELMRQDPTQRSKGGFQALLCSLQDNLNTNKGYIILNQELLKRIQRYAFGYKRGGWQRRLRKIFERTLGPKLNAA